MDNQYGLKAVENQNEITEQALEPKRQFETQLDTPLTMGEYNAIANIYQNSDNKEQDILRFGQALEYKRNYGLDLDYAYNNIDALNEARGIPQEYNWSTLQSIKNSFKISALNDKLSDLNSAWMDADYAGQDKAEIEKQIADVESQIEGLQDYAPRSLVTNMMKWAAESSVFTLTTIRDSLTWGAGAGLALAGLAGLAGVPITAGMTLTGLAWASLASAVGTAATIGGTVSVANKTQGTMYRELRNQGVEKNLARSAASINGYVNGYIETALGVVPAGVGAVLKATGVEKLTATTMARLAMRGTWGTLGKMLANHVVESVGEGEEEFFQSLADDITDAVVLTISDECKANGVKFDKSLRDVITDAIKAGGQGFGAALIMGVPTTAVNANVSVKEARRLKAEAKLNPSEADFVKHHENDSAFEGLEKKEVKDMLHQMYKAQNEVPVEERIDQTTIDSDIIEENVDIESEEDEEAVVSEVPEKDIERMENGRLRTQEEKDYDVDLEGNEKHTLKVGTPNSSTRYGRVEYTINKDGSIEIDKVSTKAGFQKAVTKDAVLELMRRYAGQEVIWNPTNAYQKKIKSELEKENGGKLQRFASEYNQSEEAELGDFLHEKYGQFTPTQGKLLYGLYNNIAQHYGQTVHEMIADAKANNPRAALRFRYMSDAVKEGLINEKQARRRGLIDYANRVIYVGENGDITTLFHEGFHMLSKVDKEGAQELVKAIAESKDMESYFKSHRAFFVPQLKLTVDEIMQELSNLSEDSDQWTENQDEILTSMFEAYLRDGKTFSKKLENIFSRIADFFIQIYRTLAGGNHLNDNIIKAFDQILEGNPELKEKFDQSQQESEGIRAQNDKAYMDAVESGDMDKAQKMVEEAARANGYTTRLYHGTQKFGWTSIDRNRLAEDAFFATDSLETAETYSATTESPEIGRHTEAGSEAGNYNLYARTDKFLEIDAEGANWDRIHVSDELAEVERSDAKYRAGRNRETNGEIDKHYVTTGELAEIAGNLGYRGVAVRNVIDNGGRGKTTAPADVYIFLHPEEDVKSADTVTYDDEGNIIPLSERFNPERNELRFQGPTPEERAEADRQYKEIEAQYKGTDQWLKAPNGQPTNLTERQWVQVRTPNFKAWFGDWENDPQNASKVVDENGEPRVVYHGSSQWFTEFNNGKQIQHSKAPKNTIFATADRDIAMSFADYYGATQRDVILDENSPLHKRYDWGVYREGGIYSIFINSKNPKVIDFGGKQWNTEGLNINDVVSQAMADGYDGVIADNVIDVGFTDVTPPPTTDYVAFSPEQIKSATDNVGTFSDNPSILFQTDTEYLDAVNSGDMAKAQAMVDQRAREMGYNSPKLYHGTQHFGWTEAKLQPLSKSNRGGELGVWTATSPDSVYYYSGTTEVREIGLGNTEEEIEETREHNELRKELGLEPVEHIASGIYQFYGKTDGMLYVKPEDSHNKAFDIMYNGKSYTTIELAQYAKDNGYKGLIIDGVLDGNVFAEEYIFFEPDRQLKSADPVTYDDAGNVIPLSQRFNDSHSSLLFQSAYHGSGASFDKFDTAFMGTGEGAQAFGWGIYLTQSEGIARGYANRMAKNIRIRYKGEIINPARNINDTPGVAMLYFSRWDYDFNNAIQELKSEIEQQEKWAHDYKEEADDKEKSRYKRGKAKEQYQRHLNVANSYKKAIALLEKQEDWEVEKARNLYTASIPDDNGSNYLYWDRPVTKEQAEKIVRAEYPKYDTATDEEKETLLNLTYLDRTGGEVYRELEKKLAKKQAEGTLTIVSDSGTVDVAPKAASEFLNRAGFVGIDYPANSMSGGNRYGKRNFVIFNADDINIQTHIRYQNELTEDERAQLLEEARDFDTFDDFLNYLSIMNGWLDPAQYSDALPVLDEIYGEAHGVTREKAKLDIDLSGLTDDEKDRTFEEYIDGDGIKTIMNLLHDMYTTYYGYVYAHGGLEDDEIEDAESLRARIREFEDNASMFIVNLAKSKKELSDKQFNSIRNVIKKNTRMYRELIADTLESETLRSDTEPDIKGTRTEERPTLADRSELEKDAGTSLDDKVEGEIEKKLDQLDKELSDDEKAAEALTRELDSLMGELKGELTPEEQKALKELKYLDRLAHRKDEYAKALKKKIDNGEAISQAENTRLETVAKKIKELEESLAKFNDKQKAKAYLDKQNALKKLRAETREKQKQRRALKEMHEYKHKLVSYLQRKVPKSVAYEYKGMIEAIISMFSDVSGYDNNITYRGKSLTPKEFREAVDKDGALDELSKYQLKRYEGKSLADYTVEELEHMADVKKRLVNVGRQMWQAKVDARNAEAAQIRQIILNHLRKNPKYTTAPLPDTEEDKKAKKSFKKKFSEMFTGTIPMSRITQMLDGGEKGFIYDLLTRDKRLVQDMERLAVRERINRVQELMDKLGVKKEDFYKPVEMSIRQSDDLGPASQIEKYTDTYTLGQLIYGIMAQRNIRNKYAFMFGDLVTQDEKAILNHNNDLIYDLGMKRNERFVKQADEILKQYPNLMQVADAIVKDWQDINNKTRLNQVMIDEYNQGLDMEDFYMPIKRLDFNGTSLAQTIADDVFNQNAGKNRTTPKKGFTKARFDITPDQQMRTNMDFLELWLNSVDEQEHLIATNAYVRKLNRVFKGRGSNDLRSAIENVYGDHINDYISKYINEIANPPATMEDRNVSRWIRFLRGRLYEAYLGFKLSSFVLQVITSPAPFLREVNAIQLSDYILKVMANPSKYWKFITERSTMMESRSIDPILAGIKKEKNDFTANQFVRTYHKALAFGTGLLEVADRWMVSAGWLACYQKAMNERQEAIDRGDMTQLQAELEASQYADEVVLETQPTGDFTELSPMFKTKSAAWQALTQFTTSLNVIWTNLLYDARTDLQNRNFKRAIMTAFAYALAGTILYAVQDYEPPEDDENWIKDTILKLIYGMTSQGVSSVPLLGSDIDKFFKETLTGERQYTARKLYPAFDTAREAVTRITQGKFDLKTLGKVTESIGLFVGLPVSGGKELLHIFRDRDGNWRYKGKRLSDNELLDFILKEKWQSVLGRRDNYGNKQHRK